jgi:hypothetical protein
MPTLTGSRDATKCIIGPGWLYLNVPVPAQNTPVSITMSTGTPPIPVPTQGLLVGYTKDGNKFTSGFTQTAIEADESKAPLWQQIATETLTIEGTLMQVVDPAVVAALLPNATYTSASGLYTFGGAVTVPAAAQVSALLIGQQRTPNDSKWVAAMLYSAMNGEAFVLNLTRKAATESSYKLEAQPVGSRPIGDQLGQLIIIP